jgi:hypothetical protein
MRAHPDRRRFLLLGGGALLAGCTVTPSESSSRRTPASAPGTRRSQSPSQVAPSPSARPTPSPGAARLPRVSRWEPDPADVSPRAKLTAVRLIERRGNGSGSALQVLDAQYGGLLAASASVLVPCRTWRLRSGRLHEGGATYDVRLTRGATGWRVSAVHPSRPGAARGRRSAEERAVLRSSRIVLPPAARADVESGQVHAAVLEALLRLSQRYRIGVSVLRSGHPLHVFGTSRFSDHPRGRAFDTFSIDGHLVVSASTPRRLVTGFMEAAAAAGAYNVGGPYLLGSAPQYFSDDTHHDHVHAGFATM